MGEFTDGQAGLISSGVQAATSLINAGIQNNQNRINRQFAREQATVAYNRMVEQWKRENAYNTPAAQMQRYIEAGLNPALIYGDVGSAMGVTAPSVPQGEAVQGKSPVFEASLTDFMQGRLMDAQINRLNTASENESKMTDSQILRFSYQNNLDESLTRKAAADIELVHAKTDEARQALANMKVEWVKLGEEAKQSKFQSAFIEATQDLRIQATNEQQRAIIETAVALAFAELSNTKADTALKWAESALAKQRIEESKQNVKESQSRIRLNNSNMAVAYNTSKLIVSQISEKNANTELIMQKIASEKAYNESVYGTEGEGWFLQGVHALTTGMDCTTRMLGNLFTFGK